MIPPLYIGIVAGVCTAVAMLPQLVKIIKTQQAEAISLKTILLLITGLLLWVYYGIEQEDYPVIITNAFSVAVNSLIVYFSLKYQKNKKPD